MAAFGDHTADLLDRLLNVPVRNDRIGDVAARIAAAPFVDMPVVIRLHQGQRILAVLEAVEQAAVEGDDAGKVQPCQHAVGVHVLDAGMDVPSTLAHLLERHRLAAIFLAHPADHRIQADIAHTPAFEQPEFLAVLVAPDFRRERLLR